MRSVASCKQNRKAACVCWLFAIAFLGPWLAFAGYKAKLWKPGSPEDFASRLTSEGVTIAARPFFRDDLAAQVFDKKDIITRGIMPLAIVVFNHNDFPVAVDAAGIRLLQNTDRLRTLSVPEVLGKLFERRGRGITFPLPVPGSSGSGLDRNAVEDFEQKFLANLLVPPRSSGWGFLFFRIPERDVEEYLRRSRVYIPDVHNRFTGKPLIYYEIELLPSIASTPPR